MADALAREDRPYRRNNARRGSRGRAAIRLAIPASGIALIHVLWAPTWSLVGWLLIGGALTLAVRDARARKRRGLRRALERLRQRMQPFTVHLATVERALEQLRGRRLRIVKAIDPESLVDELWN